MNKILVLKIEELIGKKITSINTPTQGADSTVFLLKFEDGLEIIAKIGEQIENDIAILNYLNGKSILKNLIPKILGTLEHNQNKIMLMEKAQGDLWEFSENPSSYIEKVMNLLKIINSVESTSAGYVKDVLSGKGNKSWHDFLKNRYEGKDEFYDWESLKNNKLLNYDLIQSSFDTILTNLSILPSYSSFHLIHLDPNDRNIFVDQNSKQITAIIDWSDSIFGDPLLENARFRLFLTHYYNDSLNEYWKFHSYSQTELKLESFYYLCICLDYVLWYSHDKDHNTQLNNQHIFLKTALKDFKLF